MEALGLHTGGPCWCGVPATLKVWCPSLDPGHMPRLVSALVLTLQILEGDSNVEGAELHLKYMKEKCPALDLRSIVLGRRAGEPSSMQARVFPPNYDMLPLTAKGTLRM